VIPTITEWQWMEPGRVFSVVYEPKRISVGLAYPGDDNYNGVVNFDDLLVLAKHYNPGVAPADVPGAASIVGLGVAVIGGRRRRRR
jgi:hypothetical protein